MWLAYFIVPGKLLCFEIALRFVCTCVHTCTYILVLVKSKNKTDADEKEMRCFSFSSTKETYCLEKQKLK